jgi:2-polyprenyl-6-methoxyphenol hydroxylase-like FAD-dependent oxidoreductase
LLRRLGWDVTIFERSARGLEGRGAGIVAHEELLAALNACGVEDVPALGVMVPGRVILARDGSIADEYNLPQLLASWGVIYRALLERFPAERYKLGMTLERYSQDDQSITAIFSDGSSRKCDLLIGADGINSTVRGQFIHEVKPVYAGYVAWRGLVPEKELSGATCDALMDRFGFCLPDGEQMLGYPVANTKDATAPGRRHYNFVWYRSASPETDLPALYTDAQGVQRQTPPPPGQLHPSVVQYMREEAARLLSPQFAEVVARTCEPFVQAIYDLESPRLVDGRAVLIGDAAFVARPHVGMGVTKAAGDAVALARAIENDRDLGATLSRFEHSRMAFGQKVVAEARRLGAYMQAQLGTIE